MSDTPFSILNEDGSCASEYRNIISDDDLMHLIKLILFNRNWDKRMIMLQRQGRLGFYMTSTGEETTIYGACHCLNDNDPVFLSYRELGCLFYRGVEPERILNQLIGNAKDNCKGRQMPIHFTFIEHAIPSVSSPVGTQLPHACGSAYASKYQNTDKVCLAFTGEGTTSEGDFHTALNFSGEFEVPAIFLIRNNGYAISTPETVQTRAKSLAIRGEGYGIPGIQIDGTDILAVVHTMNEAVDRARSQQGPTLIESMTYRIGAHSTADDPTAYRSDDEVQQWQQHDNLKRMIDHAKWRNLWTDEIIHDEEKKADQIINETISSCEGWPPPEVETLFEDVYESLPPHLEEQKSEYEQYLNWKREHEIP